MSSRPHRLAARTWPSQGQNTGSIPVGAMETGVLGDTLPLPPTNLPDRRLAPVLRRDLHEEAVGIPEIDRRAVCIGLIRISRFGVRQLAVDFVSEAFGSDPIHMIDCHCEMCDHALLPCH